MIGSDILGESGRNTDGLPSSNGAFESIIADMNDIFVMLNTFQAGATSDSNPSAGTHTSGTESIRERAVRDFDQCAVKKFAVRHGYPLEETFDVLSWLSPLKAVYKGILSDNLFVSFPSSAVGNYAVDRLYSQNMDIRSALEQHHRQPVLRGIVDEKRSMIARKGKGIKIKKALTVGSIVIGTVRNITSFGCFVDVGGDFDGLLHASACKPTDFAIGQVLPVRIQSKCVKRKRMALLLAEPAESSEPEALGVDSSS
jgi:hypothetical protein